MVISMVVSDSSLGRIGSGTRAGGAGFSLRAAVRVFGMVVALGLASANSAHANTYTTVLPPPGAELTQVEIMDLIYGGTFVQSGEDYSNGTLALIRVWDSNIVEETLHILTGDPAVDIDQIWTDGLATVTAEAKFAALGQSFGWNGGGTFGFGYTELLTDADVGGPGVQIDIMGDMLWGVNPTSGDMFWSRDSENFDSFDHLITFKVLGLGGPETVWLQFWEDLPQSGSDFDYNDFVVEVSAIPEPGTGFLLAIGLGLLSGSRRRR